MNQTRIPRFAWSVAGLLFAGSVVNYMDRAAIGVVKKEMCDDLSISNTGYGWAMVAFLVAYMTLYVVGGRLVDRLGYRRMFIWTVIIWSAANMIHSLTWGLMSLCLFRALLGLGEGGFYPAALRGSSEWFPADARSKAIGLYMCGLTVGTLLTPPLVAWVTAYFGWRAAFLVTGTAGFLLVPPWLLLHRRIHAAYGHPDPAPGHSLRPSDATAEEDLSLAEVLRHRKYWLILAARALTDGAWWFFLFWVPGYFQDARGFDLGMIGRWLWMPYLGADVGALAGGWLAAWIIQRGVDASVGRKLVLFPSAALGALGSLACFVDNPFFALGMLTAALLGHFSWATNIHTAVSEVSPRRHQAVLYGITGAAGTLTGALTQPLIGYVVDTAGYEPAFICVGVAYLLAMVALTAAGRIEPLRRQTNR